MSQFAKRKAKIDSISIDYCSSLIDALKLMDLIGKKLLIVFKDKKYHSLLSVGDLQRALIKKEALETPLYKILRNDIEVAYEDQDIHEIKDRMLVARTECMPILNGKGDLVDAIFWEDILNNDEERIIRKFNLPVIIMAGGKGTRLKPITNVLPKPLIPIGEKPIVELIMDKFLSYGCERIYMTINYKAEFIKHFFKLKDKQKYKINFVEEEKFLGTAGSLTLIKDKIKSTFFVSNCDILIDQDYGDILDYHLENKNEMTIVAALKHYNIPYGIMETGKNGELKAITEKPQYTFQINSGIYILEPELLSEIPENQFFHITHLMEKILARGGQVGVFPVTEKSWKDIGNWDEYLKEIRE